MYSIRPSTAMAAVLVSALAAAPLVAAPASGFGAPVFGPKRVFDQTSIIGAYEAAVGKAKKTLDVAAYQITSPDEVAAMIAAAGRGVTVRVITDSSVVANKPTVVRLKATSGISVVERPGNSGDGIMHDKYTVIDGKSVWTGSANLTPGASMVNVENAILIQSAALATDFESDFNQMWAGKFGNAKTKHPPHPTVSIADGAGGKTKVDVFFSGEDGAAEFAALAALVSKARTSVHVIAYELKQSRGAQPLIDALVFAARSGVEVKALFDDSSPVQVGMNKPAIDAIHAAGGATISWHPAFGFAHSKVIIVDGATVELGSFNYTEQAAGTGSMSGNDENILVIHDDAAVAGAYEANFHDVWTKAGGH